MGGAFRGEQAANPFFDAPGGRPRTFENVLLKQKQGHPQGVRRWRLAVRLRRDYGLLIHHATAKLAGNVG
jgi:hypothetical protein